MEEPVYFVHFPHPGGEHRPKGDLMSWNIGPHARKFMQTAGSFMFDQSVERSGEVVFWGEWEGPSKVLKRWGEGGHYPRFLHAPFWEKPSIEGSRANTDPWVFGDYFRYSNCKQLVDTKRCAPSAMQDLTPGSVIAFGSRKDDGFVLDTLIAIGRVAGRFVPMNGQGITDDESFFHSTIDSLTTNGEAIKNARFTLYCGATPRARVDGMFSFTPCLPVGDGDVRFARPLIELPGVINPKNWRVPSGAKRPRSHEEVQALWASVVGQVFDQDLALATRLELPRGR